MSQTVTLTTSKTVIPVIGYGTGTKWLSRDNPKSINKELVESIHEALSLGYRHLDAAELYGTETSTGEALRTQSIPRNEIFITSKVLENIENIEQACLDVLSRLGIDYLDLWLIHLPFFDRNKISLEQAWKQIEKLVENGKVKAIGVIEFNPYLYKASKDLIEYCKSKGIVIEAYSPLGSIVYKPGGPLDEVVEEIAKKYNRTPSQILLKWNLIKGDVVITTSSKRERLEDFLKVLDKNFELNNEDIKAIDDAGAKLHFRKFRAKEIDVFIYFGYRSHVTEPANEQLNEYHRDEINKDKEAWQRKQKEESQSGKFKPQKQYFSNPTNERQIAVRDAMRHAWKAYRTYAWGYDELLPISKTPSPWFGLGLTIVDSIDTLYIMNMTEEYKEAREWIEKSFSCDSDSVDKFNSHFEITIRILGGLLSTYHLSADDIFLQRAIELGDRLFINFNTPTRLPLAEINIKRKAASGYRWTSDSALSEVGTVQIEMRDLSRVSGEKKYEDAADKSAAVLHHQSKKDGLLPIFVSPLTGRSSGGVVSLGARGDSYYEYLLKQWLQTGQQRSTFWDDWIESMDGVRKHLWRLAYPDKLYFVGELMSMSTFSPKMDHLVCFLAGNMALGWSYKKDLTYLLDMAKDLTKTCYQTYAKQATGLSPEIAYFNTDPQSNEPTITVRDNDAHNLLRPELIESLYYMYFLTGDTIYQDWGWKIFQSFEKYTRQTDGYSSINDVRNPDNVRPRDKMESFFLAETLKYLYLLFDKKNLFPFDQWLFNTEAHPLPIYKN
ncbi:unnamed protein product [Adineta steineri]|uniref:alpha-1,2-Mannosidase n=1 Tax=Adineta steineri TaxID=433720 RepID=A0A818H4N1_9BILA|nr:unnamed protein product [Adineta steineri]